MATLLVKSLAVLGGIGGISAVGGGVYYLTSDSDSKTKDENKEKSDKEVVTPKVTVSASISRLLKEKKLRLLTNDSKDTEKWTTSWNKFKGVVASNTPTTPWSFDAWAQKKDQPEALESFKKQCEEFSKKEVTSEADTSFVAIKDYCSIAEPAT